MVVATSTALSDGGGVPSITELGSTVQRVRVCNAAAERMGCHGRPAGTWVTETSCADAGCCWFNGGGCFAPSDQRSPPDVGVVRFAAGQQPPALSNGLGEVRAPPAGELIAVTCITIPPCVSPSFPRLLTHTPADTLFLASCCMDNKRDHEPPSRSLVHSLTSTAHRTIDAIHAPTTTTTQSTLAVTLASAQTAMAARQSRRE